MTEHFAKGLVPPYYAVIFANMQAGKEQAAYDETAGRMAELAAEMPGFLGLESTRGAAGFGITVSYWQNKEAIKNWKAQGEHLAAQSQGKQNWYAHYELRVAKVERAYAGPEGR